MSRLTQANQAIQSTASDLENQGYSVTIEPDPSEIPFDLHRYRPDILATRGDENLLIDIKTRGHQRSVERYREITKIVGSQQNWRFMLSTIDTIEPVESVLIESQADSQSLKNMLGKLEHLLSGDDYDLAMPYLWSIYISSLRTVGEKADVPIDITSDKSFLNHMYSLGEMSFGEYEWAQQFLESRNRAVHRLDTNVSRESMLKMYDHIRQKLIDWNIL